jgi:hypothetical protein
MRALTAPLLAAGALAAAVAAAEPPPPQAVAAELPFLESTVPNQVVIDLAPEGARPLALLLDTASPASFATPRAARELGISVRRSKQSSYRRTTRLGRDLQLWIDARWSDTAARGGREAAILGGEFLAAYVLELDFPARRVRFLDPERYAVPERAGAPGAAVIPLRLESNRPLIEIEVGAARAPAIVATGAPGTLVLSGAAAAAGGVRDDPQATAELPPPPPGAPELRAGMADRVRIGPFEEVGVPLLVAPRGPYGQGPTSASLLGVDLLKRFVVRIDYPRRRMWLEDASPQALSPDPTPDPRR